jgi:hypothetical protein
MIPALSLDMPYKNCSLHISTMYAKRNASSSSFELPGKLENLPRVDLRERMLVLIQATMSPLLHASIISNIRLARKILSTRHTKSK